MKRIVLGALLSMTLFSCSNEVANKQNQTVARPTNPILNEEVVQIGAQVWMTKNLNVSEYSDGTPIPEVTDPAEWANLSTGAWCYYNNSTSNGTTYGKLYNVFAVAGVHDAYSMSDFSLRKRLAPIGWHIPTDAEWKTLTTFLGGASVAGGKLKQTGTTLWNSPNIAATNSSGFKGLPGGRRTANGTFGARRTLGVWWIGDQFIGADPLFIRSLGSGFGSVGNYQNVQEVLTSGFSVRCIKD
jgi:uncharacterized protein (TIGR02145 family)